MQTIDKDYVVILDDEAFEKAWKLTRGKFQRNLLRGIETLSLASLRGKASNYSSKYRQSINNLLSRLDDNGINWSEERGPFNRRILVIG